MKASWLAAILLFAVSGCSGGSMTDGGVDGSSDGAADADALTPAEMSLVGTWRREMLFGATDAVVFTLVLRSDHTSTLTIEDVRMCGTTWTFTMDRAWQASGNSLTFAPTAMCTPMASTTCTNPNGMPMYCTGPDAGGMYTFAIAGTSMTVTGVGAAMADDGMWVRR